MCDTGNCPVIDTRNVCYFPNLNGEGYYAAYPLPFSCVAPQDGVDYKQYLYDKSVEICSAMGDGEWQSSSDSADNYLTTMQTAFIGYHTQPPFEPGVLQIYYYYCLNTFCDNMSGTQQSIGLDPSQFTTFEFYYTPPIMPKDCYDSDPNKLPKPRNDADPPLNQYAVVCERSYKDNAQIDPIFNGDPTICCLQNLYCDIGVSDSKTQDTLYLQNYYNPKCFDDNVLASYSGGCSLENRRLSQGDCFTRMMTYCSTGNPIEIGSKWYGSYDIKRNDPLRPSYSVTNGCLNAFFKILYADDNDSVGPPSTFIGNECYNGYIGMMETNDLNLLPLPEISNARRAQLLLQKATQNYVAGGGNLAAPEGTPNSSGAYNTMIKSLCSQFPGICQEFLTEFCVNVTKNDMIKNPTLVEVCGCYLPASLTSEYTDTFQINPECTPYCNLPGTIPIPVSVNASAGRVCQQSVCIINDVTLNFIDSQVSDQGVDIGNFCGSCNTGTGKGACSCILSDVTFVSINSKISNLNLTQQCTSGTCYTTSKKNGQTIQTVVPCNSQDALAESVTSINKSQTLMQAYSIIGILLLVIIALIVIYYIIYPNATIFGRPKLNVELDPPFMGQREYTSIKNVF